MNAKRYFLLLGILTLCAGQVCAPAPPAAEPVSEPEVAQNIPESVPEPEPRILLIPAGIYEGTFSCVQTVNVDVSGTPSSPTTESLNLPRLELFGREGIPLSSSKKPITVGYDRAHNVEDFSLIVTSIVISDGRLDIFYDVTSMLDFSAGASVTMTGTRIETFTLQSDRTLLFEQEEYRSGTDFDPLFLRTVYYGFDSKCSGILQPNR